MVYKHKMYSEQQTSYMYHTLTASLRSDWSISLRQYATAVSLRPCLERPGETREAVREEVREEGAPVGMGDGREEV